MKRTISITLFTFFFYVFGYSQAVYKINYHYDLDIGREDYSALLYCYEDGSGEARIRFVNSENQEENIVEVQLEQHAEYDQAGDVTYLYFATYDPVSIKGSVVNNDDHYVFRKVPGSDEFEPDGVLSVDEYGEVEITGEIDDIILLDESDINKVLFDEFFLPHEDVYINEVVNETRPLTPANKMVKLNLVLVANTLDKKIGLACETDKKNVLALFSEVADYLGIGFSHTVLEGERFTRHEVMNTLNNLKPDPNDVVVFYYSGHGYNSKSKFPNIDLRYKSSMDVGGENAMNMEEIYNFIISKNARLNLVISDCCNNEISDASSEIPEAPSLRTTSVGWSKLNVMNLFLNSKKSFIMTAASKGELSSGNRVDGGIFTSNFLDNIEKGIGKFSGFAQNNWDYIITQSRTRTIDKAASSKCRMPDTSVRPCAQTPLFLLK